MKLVFNHKDTQAISGLRLGLAFLSRQKSGLIPDSHNNHLPQHSTHFCHYI